jgi:hypothetical protein
MPPCVYNVFQFYDSMTSFEISRKYRQQPTVVIKLMGQKSQDTDTEVTWIYVLEIGRLLTE